MLPQADHLSDVLRRHCADRGWTPLHLPSSEAADEEQLLQELIACREAGDADLSLELIQLAEQHGWESPWLEDNKARAELALGRPEQACAIWESLTSTADENAAAIATASLKKLRGSLKLQTTLLACCRASGWQPRHLGNPAEAAFIGLGQALSEIGACRESGRPDLSLKLITLCRQSGESSPWLEDNQARLEVERRRFWSAAERWYQLQQGSDPEAAAVGKEMIEVLERDFREQNFNPEWLSLNNDSSHHDALLAVLEEALHQQRSSHAAFTHRLLRLAQEQGWLGAASIEEGLSPWNEIHRMWQRVEQHPDPTIQAKGSEGIRQHGQQTEEALQLQAALINDCRKAGWSPQHLGVADSPASIGLDQALLEILECRDRGATLLSQMLIERCQALGWSCPWLMDNQAWLLQPKDPETAKAIWADLIEHSDPQVRHFAQHALDLNNRFDTEASLTRAITAARDHGLKTLWQPLLLKRLLDEDAEDSPSWRREAIQGPLHCDEAWDLHLRRHRLFHALVEEQLDQLKKKPPDR
ncbi:conserved hypothetical protein [Synechococcus sp. WH 8103]|nr:conserved hypothetical protein [Synechococcus sp. WH 8103]